MLPSSPRTADEIEAELDRLHSRLTLFIEFAEAHEKWEAECLLSDGPWFDEMPGGLMSGLEDLQELRNRALGR